ncbi:MAG TPA: hypothetical protein PLG99_07020, partial [Kaistiaceae bacterium]|nr:hypothetical protein [Kaistiaceae bacterium]
MRPLAAQLLAEAGEGCIELRNLALVGQRAIGDGVALFDFVPERDHVEALGERHDLQSFGKDCGEDANLGNDGLKYAGHGWIGADRSLLSMDCITSKGCDWLHPSVTFREADELGNSVRKHHPSGLPARCSDQDLYVR